MSEKKQFTLNGEIDEIAKTKIDLEKWIERVKTEFKRSIEESEIQLLIKVERKQ